MTPLSTVDDSTHSLQGREGVEHNIKPKAAEPGKAMQVGGSELPARATVNAVVDAEKMEALKNELNQSEAFRSRQIAFELTEDYPTPLLKVVDEVSGEVIRQIPNEDVLHIREKLAQSLETMEPQTGSIIEIDT